jgi:hypothetical protein
MPGSSGVSPTAGVEAAISASGAAVVAVPMPPARIAYHCQASLVSRQFPLFA